jgi:hypothetical protein
MSIHIIQKIFFAQLFEYFTLNIQLSQKGTLSNNYTFPKEKM